MDVDLRRLENIVATIIPKNRIAAKAIWNLANRRTPNGRAGKNRGGASFSRLLSSHILYAAIPKPVSLYQKLQVLVYGPCRKFIVPNKNSYRPRHQTGADEQRAANHKEPCGLGADGGPVFRCEYSD